MSLSRYRQVVLFCPTAITGGPEAIHQFGQTLNGFGVTASIVHVGPRHRVKVQDGRIVSPDAPHPAMTQAFAQYGPRYQSEIPVTADTLLVFPEALASYQKRVAGCGVAIWWLSVDNFLRALQGRDGAAEMKAVFGRSELIHLYQSAYARDWLKAEGATRLFDLFDYTSPAFTSPMASGPSPAPKLAYNGAKGSDLARSFFAAHPEFEALPLVDFSRPELLQIFRERAVYVDFGHFPGKDRLPREAAACGSVVFVHRRGSAAHPEDFPLPEAFKFTEAEVASGALADRIGRAMADPQGAWTQQSAFREAVAGEKAQFEAQVRRHWS